MLVLPCGFGKTILSIHLALTLKRKTIVLVHTELLMHQWIQNIKAVCPNANIGILQGKKIDIQDKDFVICMLQSLAKKKYNKDLLIQFGTVIVDEAHHIGAKMFGEALRLIACHNVIGLTATPDRSDDLGYTLPMHLGPIAYRAHREAQDIDIQRIDYNGGERKEIVYRNGNLGTSAMISELALDEERNQLIIQQIVNILEKEPTRHILVLSDRLIHITFLLEGLKLKNPLLRIGKVTGGKGNNNNKKRKFEECDDNTEEEDVNVLFSTFKYASEGFDKPCLDTLILATPYGKIEQSVGRILRDHPLKCKPTVIDIVDTWSYFEKLYFKRRRYYMSLK